MILNRCIWGMDLDRWCSGEDVFIGITFLYLEG